MLLDRGDAGVEIDQLLLQELVVVAGLAHHALHGVDLVAHATVVRAEQLNLARDVD